MPEYVDEIEISDRHRMYKVSRVREAKGRRKEESERESNGEIVKRERERERDRWMCDATSNQRKSLG